MYVCGTVLYSNQRTNSAHDPGFALASRAWDFNRGVPKVRQSSADTGQTAIESDFIEVTDAFGRLAFRKVGRVYLGGAGDTLTNLSARETVNECPPQVAWHRRDEVSAK